MGHNELSKWFSTPPISVIYKQIGSTKPLMCYFNLRESWNTTLSMWYCDLWVRNHPKYSCNIVLCKQTGIPKYLYNIVLCKKMGIPNSPCDILICERTGPTEIFMWYFALWVKRTYQNLHVIYPLFTEWLSLCDYSTHFIVYPLCDLLPNGKSVYTIFLRN